MRFHLIPICVMRLQEFFYLYLVRTGNMVCTRSSKQAFLAAKALRLQETLARKGLLRGHTHMFFGASKAEVRLTVRTQTWRLMNPKSVFFIRQNEDGSVIPILAGCIHNNLHRCEGCNVDVNEDIKDDVVFGRNRAWAVCRLWNLDPYVVGEDSASFVHCSLPETRRGLPLMLTA